MAGADIGLTARACPADQADETVRARPRDPGRIRRTGPSPAEAFLVQARSRPEATALVWRAPRAATATATTEAAAAATDREIGYGALADLVDSWRERLSSLPLTADEPVAVPASKTPGTVALVLACMLESRPVLLPAEGLGAEVRSTLYERAGVRYELKASDGTGGPEVTESPDGVGIHKGPGAPAAPRERPLLLLTTSGSTGTPKVVPLDAGAVTAFTDWAAAHFGIGPGTAVLNYAPLNFDLCLLDVWTTLAHGGRVVLVDPECAASGPALLDLVGRQAPEVVQAVPMFYRLLADAAAAAGDRTLPGVRHAVFTGDVMPLPLLARLPRLLPDARLSNVYGCTETNDSFLHEVDVASVPTVPVPLGSPLPGVHALLVAEDGSVLEGPGSGELYVSTPFQTCGSPGGEGVFVRDPGPGAPAGDRRWFRSGDLVRREPDGTHVLLGRTDFQVKVRGVRVNTQAIEEVLLAHPEVTEAAVLTLPDPVGGRQLLAVVRRTAGSRLNSLVLRGHLARRLPRAAVPATVRIGDEPLPRTSTGKVDRDRAATAHGPSSVPKPPSKGRRSSKEIRHA